jgi:hypothetical protein
MCAPLSPTTSTRCHVCTTVAYYECSLPCAHHCRLLRVPVVTCAPLLPTTSTHCNVCTTVAYYEYLLPRVHHCCLLRVLVAMCASLSPTTSTHCHMCITVTYYEYLLPRVHHCCLLRVLIATCATLLPTTSTHCHVCTTVASYKYSSNHRDSVSHLSDLFPGLTQAPMILRNLKGIQNLVYGWNDDIQKFKQIFVHPFPGSSPPPVRLSSGPRLHQYRHCTKRGLGKALNPYLPPTHVYWYQSNWKVLWWEVILLVT